VSHLQANVVDGGLAAIANYSQKANLIELMQ
jgi:hypothetical protein